MGFAIFYLSGMLVSVILILILAHYEERLGNNIEDLPGSIGLAIWSWIMVALFIIVYKDTYKAMIKSWFK